MTTMVTVIWKISKPVFYKNKFFTLSQCERIQILLVAKLSIKILDAQTYLHWSTYWILSSSTYISFSDLLEWTWRFIIMRATRASESTAVQDRLLNNWNMLRAPKTVLDSVFNADPIFDIFKIVKISYFFKSNFSKLKVWKILGIWLIKKAMISHFECHIWIPKEGFWK